MNPAADAAQHEEFRRFGPWIDEIRGPQDLPRLFRAHPVDFHDARLVLKVPRDVHRRDARPEMHLYDHVLAVGSEALTILSRRAAPGHGIGDERGGRGDDGDDWYDTRVVPYHRIAAVRDTVSLLAGALTLSTADGQEVTVRYNGSARESIALLVDELRLATSTPVPARAGRAVLVAAQGFARPGAEPRLGRSDVALEGAFRELALERPSLVPWVWHARQRVAPRFDGVDALARKISHLGSPMTLHAGIVASDTLTLEVLGRHEWLLRGVTPVHSSSHLVVPLQALDDLRLLSHPGYEGAVVVRLLAGRSASDVVVPEGSDAHAMFSRAAEALQTVL